MLARRSGAWFKKALFVAAAKRQFNSFYTIKRVAHYCAVLKHATVTGSQKIGFLFIMRKTWDTSFKPLTRPFLGFVINPKSKEEPKLKRFKSNNITV